MNPLNFKEFDKIKVKMKNLLTPPLKPNPNIV